MTKKRRPPAIPQELPPCNGPKLHLFKHHDCEIQWLERIGGDEEMETPHEGYVFRAIIQRVEYAVKVFKFFDPMDREYFWEPLVGDAPLNTVAYYTDPFYAECRAYGRIRDPFKGKRKISDAAIRCHGFMFLSDKDQQYLEENEFDLGLSSVSQAYQHQTIEGFRPRAIVKDLASPDPGVTGDTLRRILNRIVSLNQHQIYNLDIRLDNLRDGKLIDFGTSWTEPHILLDALGADEAHSRRTTDRAMFDEMVEDEEISNPKEVIAVHPMRLRSRFKVNDA